MKQTKLISLIEASLSTATGFIVAMLIWAFVVPVLYPHLEPTITQNFVVTCVFTVASVLRAYFWRRFFNNGVHSLVVNWVGRMWSGSGGGGGNPEVWRDQ